MADVHSKEVRSYNMSRIKGKDTRPEMLVRKFLFSHGYRYRLHHSGLPGKPDLVLAKHKTVIFVHGCFWHGHSGCKYFIIPKTRTDWWTKKIDLNRINDRKYIKRLRQDHWKVITIFECDLRRAKREGTFSRLLSSLSQNR